MHTLPKKQRFRIEENLFGVEIKEVNLYFSPGLRSTQKEIKLCYFVDTRYKLGPKVA